MSQITDELRVSREYAAKASVAMDTGGSVERARVWADMSMAAAMRAVAQASVDSMKLAMEAMR